MSSFYPLMGALLTAQVHAAGNLPANLDVTEVAPAFLVAGFDGTYRVSAVLVFAAALLALFTWMLDKKVGIRAASQVQEKSSEIG